MKKDRTDNGGEQNAPPKEAPNSVVTIRETVIAVVTSDEGESRVTESKEPV